MKRPLAGQPAARSPAGVPLDRMFRETEMVYHEVLQEVRRGRKMKGKYGADP